MVADKAGATIFGLPFVFPRIVGLPIDAFDRSYVSKGEIISEITASSAGLGRSYVTSGPDLSPYGDIGLVAFGISESRFCVQFLYFRKNCDFGSFTERIERDIHRCSVNELTQCSIQFYQTNGLGIFQHRSVKFRKNLVDFRLYVRRDFWQCVRRGSNGRNEYCNSK